MEKKGGLIQFSEARNVISVKKAIIDGSKFEDVRAKNITIINADLSYLEVESARICGAYFHNVGVAPKAEANSEPDVKSRPLTFEDCNLSGTVITNCNLSGLDICDCNLQGMRINGILVEELLRGYK